MKTFRPFIFAEPFSIFQSSMNTREGKTHFKWSTRQSARR